MPPDREEGEEDVMGMTREEARNELVLWRNRNSDNGYHYKFVEALTIAIKALEQQPCEDCISREKAKQFLYERLDRLNNDELYDIFSTIIDDMYNELPSVTPQPFINKPCVSEGVCREDKIQVLDKIKAEINGMYRVILKDTPKDDWAVRRNIQMGYKKYGRCKECKKIYRYGFVPHICKKCGCALFKDNLIFGTLSTEYLEVITAKKKFPFGYDVKECDDK